MWTCTLCYVTITLMYSPPSLCAPLTLWLHYNYNLLRRLRLSFTRIAPYVGKTYLQEIYEQIQICYNIYLMYLINMVLLSFAFNNHLLSFQNLKFPTAVLKVGSSSSALYFVTDSYYCFANRLKLGTVALCYVFQIY